MDMYPRYKSKFGYQIGNNQIDSYGVDHSGFTTQDEVAYQFAREEKENSLLASNIRETHDRMTGSNKLDNSMCDQYANMIGRLLGSKYPDGDCNALIQKYIKRKY